MTRILIIDDSDLVRQLLQEGLTQAGFEVEIALDANHGYSTALDVQPDLILMDIQLPDVTGFELCRVIRNRAELHEVPIIMITGTAHSTGEKVKGFQLGADDYVQKPFEMPELIERIRAILRRKGIPLPAEPAALSPRPAPTPPVESPPVLASVSQAPLRAVLPMNGPVATISPIAPLDPLADAVRKQEAPPMSILAAATQVLARPGKMPTGTALPHIALPYLLVANGLTLTGLAVAAGGALKPVAAMLSVTLLWGLAVSVVVMASSIVGIPLGWKQGARLFSLAAIPFLLRVSGGVVLALTTTLSPFYFSMGPALFSKTPAGWMEGLDLSVVWTVYLCGRLLGRADARHARKAWGVAGGLWLFFVVMSMIARKLS